jgi:hypothetical protein
VAAAGGGGGRGATPASAAATALALQAVAGVSALLKNDPKGAISAALLARVPRAAFALAERAAGGESPRAFGLAAAFPPLSEGTTVYVNPHAWPNLAAAREAAHSSRGAPADVLRALNNGLAAVHGLDGANSFNGAYAGVTTRALEREAKHKKDKEQLSGRYNNHWGLGEVLLLQVFSDGDIRTVAAALGLTYDTVYYLAEALACAIVGGSTRLGGTNVGAAGFYNGHIHAVLFGIIRKAATALAAKVDGLSVAGARELVMGHGAARDVLVQHPDLLAVLEGFQLPADVPIGVFMRASLARGGVVGTLSRLSCPQELQPAFTTALLEAGFAVKRPLEGKPHLVRIEPDAVRSVEAQLTLLGVLEVPEFARAVTRGDTVQQSAAGAYPFLPPTPSAPPSPPPPAPAPPPRRLYARSTRIR